MSYLVKVNFDDLVILCTRVRRQKVLVATSKVSNFCRKEQQSQCLVLCEYCSAFKNQKWVIFSVSFKLNINYLSQAKELSTMNPKLIKDYLTCRVQLTWNMRMKCFIKPQAKSPLPSFWCHNTFWLEEDLFSFYGGWGGGGGRKAEDKKNKRDKIPGSRSKQSHVLTVFRLNWQISNSFSAKGTVLSAPKVSHL